MGEATPIGPDGRCSHPLTVPNNARTHCILPARVDVGLHYLVRALQLLCQYLLSPWVE